MLKNFSIIISLTSFLWVIPTFGTPLNQLNGTWILDAKATETSILNMPPSPNADKLAEWFGLASMYMCLLTYEVDSSNVSLVVNGKKRTYTFLSKQKNEIKYIFQENESSTPETLIILLLNDVNIKIVHEKMPEMNSLLWKHGELSSDNTKAAIDSWVASLEVIIKSLRAQSKTP